MKKQEEILKVKEIEFETIKNEMSVKYDEYVKKKEKEIVQLETQLENNAIEVQDLKLKIEQMNKQSEMENSNMRIQVESMKLEAMNRENSLKFQLDKCRSDLELAETQFNGKERTLQSQILALQESSVQDRVSTSKELSTVKSHLETQVESLTLELSQTKENSKNIISSQEKAINELKLYHSQLEFQLENKTKYIEELKLKIDEIREKYRLEIEELNREKESKIKELKNQVEERDFQVERMRKNMLESSDLSQQSKERK